MKLLYREEGEISSLGMSFDDLEDYGDVHDFDYGDSSNDFNCQELDLIGLASSEKMDWTDNEDITNLKLSFNDGDVCIVPCRAIKANSILNALKDKKRLSSKEILKCF